MDEAGVNGWVVWHVTMSLDGFIAGPDDAMEFGRGHASGPNPIADDVRNATAAILAGRRWHDVATERHDGRRGIYGGAWSGPVLVLTHRPHDASPDPEIRFVSGPIEDAVATARQAAGGAGHVGVFGADVGRQCIEAGLLDEIVVHIAPVLLGDGIRLYGSPGASMVALERTALTESGQLTNLRFRVRR
ncbi:MAG TPA: dihydrofolate reductase family protein [Solirubrobacteraceae bacterium]|jgi:dihydrofolate reductase|nr:dihydrofolate reductase family protein [Solirubrobacteraceae bacterium]